MDIQVNKTNNNFPNETIEPNSSNNLALIIATIVVIAVIIIGIYWFMNQPSAPNITPSENDTIESTADLPNLESASEASIADEVIVESAAEGVVELNPAEAANPFSDIYENPFAE